MVSFFRNLFGRSHARPAVRTADTPLAFYLNGEGRLQAVKQDGLLRGNYHSRVGLGYLLQNQEQYARAAIASVWAANCINLRADTLARLDWHVRDKKTKEIIDEHPFAVALENSQQNVIRLFEKRLLTYGEVFIKPLHNEYNQPSGFFVLNNLDVDIDTSPGYVAGFQYNPQGRGRTWHFKPEQLIYIHTDNDFDDFRGLSKFEHVLLEIHIDRDISRTTAAFYRNDARPGLLLIPETDLTKERADEFIEYWNARFKGPDNTARPAILPSVIKEVREFQRAPALDDVELRESTRRETCAAFKTPLSMAGAWDDATYQSLPEQRKAFYEETIIPEAESVARDLTKAALPYFDNNRQNEVYFDAEKIMSLVANVAGKVDVATRKLNSGAYTINEIRQELDDKPILGGDIHIMQSGWIPVHSNDLATFEAPNTQQMPDNAPPQLPAGNPPEMITAPDNNPPDTTQARNDEPTRSRKDYNRDQPRESNGQFGSGGGSSGSSGGGGGDDGENGSSDSSSSGSSNKPKEGKPDWATSDQNNAHLDGRHIDLGHIDNNPANSIGRNQVQQLSSEQVGKLSDTHKAAVKEYTGDSYKDINDGLRGKGQLSETNKRTVDALDSAMQQNQLDVDRVLYRSMRANDSLREQIKPGREFTDPSYTSTSFDQYNNNRYGGASSEDMDWRIKAPQGQHGLAASEISDYPEESEYILPRNTRYRVTDVHVDPETGRTYVDAEIIGG